MERKSLWRKCFLAGNSHESSHHLECQRFGLVRHQLSIDTRLIKRRNLAEDMGKLYCRTLTLPSVAI